MKPRLSLSEAFFIRRAALSFRSHAVHRIGPHGESPSRSEWSVEPNLFETANAGFAQAMYEEFLRDPAAVGAEWRRLFESGVVGERPATNGRPADAPKAAATDGAAPADLPAGAVPIKGPAARPVQNMAESLTVPTATTFRELPVAILEAQRKSLNAAYQTAGQNLKISLTHIIAW